MELQMGQIVSSRAGRDVGRFYMVTGLCGDRVLLANGGKWTLAVPKPKNIRHVNPTKTLLPPEQRSTDVALRAVLEAFAKECKGPSKGG